MGSVARGQGSVWLTESLRAAFWLTESLQRHQFFVLGDPLATASRTWICVQSTLRFV